jgi:hypothetical protein
MPIDEVHNFWWFYTPLADLGFSDPSSSPLFLITLYMMVPYLYVRRFLTYNVQFYGVILDPPTYPKIGRH